MSAAVNLNPYAPRRRHAAPLQLVGATEHKQTQPTSETAECAVCEKKFVGAAIVTDFHGQGPTWSETHQSWWIERRLYCDHCNHVQVVVQACRQDGTLLPVILSGPAWIRSRSAIEKFLAKCPQAAGVEQA